MERTIISNVSEGHTCHLHLDCKVAGSVQVVLKGNRLECRHQSTETKVLHILHRVLQYVRLKKVYPIIDISISNQCADADLSIRLDSQVAQSCNLHLSARTKAEHSLQDDCKSHQFYPFDQDHLRRIWEKL